MDEPRIASSIARVINAVPGIGNLSYVELGIGTKTTFDFVNSKSKISVDRWAPFQPDYCMTTDQFFAQLSADSKFDVWFIDSDHQYPAVLRDFNNVVRHLTPGGYVFVHDLVPPTEEHAWSSKCSDGYRLLHYILANHLMPTYVHESCYGLTLFRPTSPVAPPEDHNISYGEFMEFLKGVKRYTEGQFKTLLQTLPSPTPELPRAFVATVAPEEKPAGNDLLAFFVSEGHKTIFKHLHYFEIYDRHFSRFRGTDVQVLEIGVAGGGSLQMWKHYFGPKSWVYGIDCLESCKRHEEERVSIFVGNQQDPQFLLDVVATLPKLDIVIDDGGHLMKQQLVSFKTLFPLLSERGIYLCEDCQTSYNKSTGGGFRNPDSFIEFSKSRIDKMNAWFTPDTGPVDSFTTSIGSIAFYPGVVVFEKQPRERADLAAEMR